MLARRVLALVVLVVSLAGCSRAGGRSPASGVSSLPWEADLDSALTRAASENKLIMVDFYTDWCRWCQVLEEKTFTDPAVQSELGRLVVVKLDAERGGRQAARRYRVSGFPTLVFIDAEGKEVGRIPGFLPAAPFLEELSDILGKA